MATSSLLGRRIFLTAAQRSTSRAFQSTALRASSSSAAAATSTTFHSHNTSDQSRFVLLSAAALTLAATTAAANNNDSSKCCGIAGVVGAKGDARDYLIEGLTILKNRGYDSAGIATMDDNKSELVVSCTLCIMSIFILFSEYEAIYKMQLLYQHLLAHHSSFISFYFYSLYHR